MQSNSTDISRKKQDLRFMLSLYDSGSEVSAQTANVIIDGINRGMNSIKRSYSFCFMLLTNTFCIIITPFSCYWQEINRSFKGKLEMQIFWNLKTRRFERFVRSFEIFICFLKQILNYVYVVTEASVMIYRWNPKVLIFCLSIRMDFLMNFMSTISLIAKR